MAVPSLPPIPTISPQRPTTPATIGRSHIPPISPTQKRKGPAVLGVKRRGLVSRLTQPKFLSLWAYWYTGTVYSW